LTKELHFPHKR